MPLQAYKNLAYSLVATAPSPADTGTSLVVTGGHGTRFPSVPFNATIWPADSIPTPTNAEIVTVTNISTDTFTITRAQESSTARTVIVGDQIAATITALTLATLEADISAVSAAVTSVNTHANTASAAATSADGHAATASAAATSADGHAATASAAATSVDARVNTVSNLVSALTSAHNALSNVVSDSLSAGTVASNLLSNVVSALSTLSQAHSALSSQVSVNSVALTSVDAHAAAASAAATSVLAGISAVSARSVGGVSTHGLQSVVNALSNRISAVVAGAASVTSNELSALAASVETLSAKVVSISAQIVSVDAHAATASAAATSADGHAAAASAAATSVLAGISAVSARSVGGVSTHGLQSVVDALSNRISAIPGAGSVNAVGIVATTTLVSTVAGIPGLTVSVSTGKLYRLEGLVMCNMATTSAPRRFGMNIPPMKHTRGWIQSPLTQQPGGAGNVSSRAILVPWNGDSTNGSNVLSMVPPSPVSSVNFLSTFVMYEGVLNVSTGGVVVLIAGSSAGIDLTILPGSYVRVFKLN